jgi:membrane protein GlpM
MQVNRPLGGKPRNRDNTGIGLSWASEDLIVALLLKSLVGALAVLIIALLSKSRIFFVAGLVPLFPTFALIAHFIVGADRGAVALRTTALFGLWSMIPYAVYLFAVYWLSIRLSLTSALVCATLAWCATAGVLLVVWSRVFPSVS